MTTDTVKLLARYNAHVNSEMNAIISGLTPAGWEKDLGGYFKSIRLLCSHIYISDMAWMKRFGTLRPFESLKHPAIKKEFTRDSAPFAGIAEYMMMRSGLDSIIVSFADEITGDDLGTSLHYRNWKGEEQNRNVGGLIMHVFNHQTHHRGMVSLYLDLLWIENDFSNLAALV